MAVDQFAVAIKRNVITSRISGTVFNYDITVVVWRERKRNSRNLRNGFIDDDYTVTALYGSTASIGENTLVERCVYAVDNNIS